MAAGIVLQKDARRHARLFAIALFAAAVIIIAGAGIVLFEYFSQDAVRSAQEDLRVIARLKAKQIELTIDERIRNGQLFAVHPVVQNVLGGRSAQPAPREHEKQLSKAIADARRIHDYDLIVLLDSAMQVVTPRPPPPLGPAALAAIGEAISKREAVVADLHAGPQEAPAFGVACPVLADGNPASPVVGAVYLQRDGRKDFAEVLSASSTRGASAGIGLMRKEGGEIVVMSFSGEASDGHAVTERYPETEDKHLAVQAMTQGAGLITAIDSRGAAVVGAANPVARTRWVLASTIERSEIEKPVRRLGAATALLALFLIAAAGGMAWLVWRWRTQSLVAERVALIQRYAAAVSTSIDGYMVVKEPERRIVEVNPAFSRITGYTEEELLALGVHDLVPNATLDQVEARARRLIEAGTDRFQAKWTRKDGAVIDVEISLSFVPGEGHAFAFVRDITERNRVEARLRASEERLNLAIEASNLALWDWDIPGGRVYLSEHWSVMLGNPPHAIETTFAELEHLVHPEEGAAIENELKAALKGTLAEYRREHRLKKASGDWLWVLTRGRVVARGPDGRALRMTGTNIDITDQKLAGLALAQSEERFRGLVEQSVVGIYLVDTAQMTLVYANPFLLRLLGYELGEVLGMKPEQFVVDEDWPLLEASRASLRRGERNVQYKLRMRGKHGQVRDMEMHSIMTFQKGKPVLMGLAQDITARNRMEAEIRALNADLECRVAERTRDLERANRELDSFAYSVSHDLRGPARAMAGFAAILVEDNENRLDAASLSYLNRIDAGARRMLQLIDDLLSLSRVSRAELKRQEVDLSALALNVASELAQAHQGRDVAIAVETGLRVNGDPGLIRIVLENLIGNAWKFTSRAEAARIEVGRRRNGEETVHFVRDNGAGFDMRYADKLFGAFQRLHRRDEFEGTGIGLSIVQRIVERHGGKVWAESQPGRGASFFLTLG